MSKNRTGSTLILFLVFFVLFVVVFSLGVLVGKGLGGFKPETKNYADDSGIQYEWDMKLWWPHTETMYALLLAHHLTGEKKWEDWYDKVHEYSFNHFPDKENGEWFGYLHRDGSLASTVKGNGWKGPFHLPRTLLYGLKLLEEMKEASN